jgi:HSP20 family protein
MARDEQRDRGLPARRGETGIFRSPWEDPWTASPFSMLRRMQEDMDRIFGGFGGFGGSGGGFPQAFTPNIDMHETENEVIVKADVPGVEPEDLEVYCTDNALIVRGEMRREEQRDERGIHRAERRYGRFERALPLPAEVNRDQIQASFRNGVLELHLPKTEEGRQRMRRIPIQGARTLSGMKGGETAGEAGQAATGEAGQSSAGTTGTSQTKKSTGQQGG